MASRKLEISPQRADSIKKAQETCESVRNSVILQMTSVLQNTAADSTEVAQEYVRNRLKKHILDELAGTGSTTQPYTLDIESVREVVGRLKGWASALFPAEAVQKLRPETIFEQVWDEVIQELQVDDEVAVEHAQQLPKKPKAKKGNDTDTMPDSSAPTTLAA